MKKILFLIFALLILTPTVALAATFRTTNSGTSSVSSKETLKNAYLTGSTVSVEGIVAEDLFAAGTTISLTGTVNDNATLAASSITLNGKVGKSVRAVGQSVTINSSVGSDLFIASSTVSLAEASTVRDDLAVIGETIDLNGTVGGKAYLSAGQITINGKVHGDVIIKNTNKVIIGEDAVIEGNLDYGAQQEAIIATGATINGTVNFTKIADPNSALSEFKTGFTLFALMMALGIFILLLVLIYAFPKLTRNLVEKSYTRPWENLGVGFIYLIVIPVAAVILACTVVGIPLAAIVFALFGATLGLTKILVPILVGTLLYKWFTKKNTYRLDWLTALIGVIATLIIAAIPFVGSLSLFVVFLIGLSQFAHGGIQLFKMQR